MHDEKLCHECLEGKFTKRDKFGMKLCRICLEKPPDRPRGDVRDKVILFENKGLPSPIRLKARAKRRVTDKVARVQQKLSMNKGVLGMGMKKE